jgi:hypothetical protein
MSVALTNLTLPGNGCSSPKCDAVLPLNVTNPLMCVDKSNEVPAPYNSLVIVNVTPVNDDGVILLFDNVNCDVKSIAFQAELVGWLPVVPVCAKTKNLLATNPLTISDEDVCMCWKLSPLNDNITFDTDDVFPEILEMY